jgi:hypothetical protein
VEELRLKLEEIHSDVRRLDGRNGA